MEALLEVYPDAAIFAVVCQQDAMKGWLAGRPVHTSFIQRLPWSTARYAAYLPLMPLAVEQFDLGGYDVVISLSHAVAKGALTRAGQLHLCYVFTPMRYAWDFHFAYLRHARLDRGVRGLAARSCLHYLRLWDQTSASRPDVMVADSRYVAARVRKLYRRESPVIYPPVDVNRFTPRLDREAFYLTVSRQVAYKRIDVIVEAFNRLEKPLVVIGEGPESGRLRRLAGPTIELLGEQPDEVVADYMGRCRAFVFAAEEDFGIAPVEAQAAGAPVLAYGRGGVTETVVAGETGLFFNEQTPESIIDTVRTFESGVCRFHPELLRRAAGRFGKERFQREFQACIAQQWGELETERYEGTVATRQVAAD